MKVFMLGWEFPPYISGGLGTACYGLTKAMDELGIEVTFVLPKASTGHHTGHVKMLSAQHFEEGRVSSTFKNVRFLTITSTLRPYAHATAHGRQLGSLAVQQTKTPANINLGQINDPDNYDGDIYSQVCRYADKVVRIAATENFDVIHAHDWMTYPAGEAVSQQSRKPLIVHVHSTEFDRSGEHVNQAVYDTERMGMHAAAKVIAVSNLTKNTILKHYGVPSEKVEVVHNAVEHNGDESPRVQLDKTDKIVLFLGRITMQKGPEYFLAAAKKVLEEINNVKFIMAGNGDMMHRTIELAARMGIGHKVLFTGFLRGEDVDRAYQMADLYVMPSVSEPFGIAPLEAMNRSVPVLISKQSGIAEVVTHALKVDFWDINEMANKMIAVLKRPSLQKTLSGNGFHESHKFNWEDSAMKVKKIYEEVIAQAQSKEK
ncbi:MAG: glycosyltransferase family 4 protein [Sedimentisphaerales bacterium]|jgi:glycosyltransferase involved in cell wall biosynthesis